MQEFRQYLKELKTKLEVELTDDDIIEIQLKMFVQLFENAEFQNVIGVLSEDDNEQPSEESKESENTILT